jgi:NADH-quinone oxidoreductase subunit H
MPPPAFLTAQFIVHVAVIVLAIHILLVSVAYSVYLERKISAYIQDRAGPNRVGFDFGLPFLSKLRGMKGLGQPLADGMKFLTKEDYTPPRADKVLFTLAPLAVIVPVLIGFAIIPWGGVWTVPDFVIPILGWPVQGGPVHVAGAYVNVGVIYLVAIAALGVYGVTLGGWASNNKYSFLGGLRATAQMLSYEIPLALSLLAVILLMGTVLPQAIIRHQVEHGWLIFHMPLAAIIFFTAAIAEANRAPFDNAEAEQELVGGYHTEYSSMRLALFFLAEYAHLITSMSFFTLLFLGGYHLPLLIAGHPLSPENTTLIGVLLKVGAYLLKVGLLVCFVIVIRWTLPRMRFDQVMMMGWQALIPLSMIVLIMTSIMVYLNLTWVVPMFLVNLLVAGTVLLLYPFLPHYNPNRRLPLYGSRFSPVPGERILTRPTEPTALEDRPVEGTAPVH